HEALVLQVASEIDDRGRAAAGLTNDFVSLAEGRDEWSGDAGVGRLLGQRTPFGEAAKREDTRPPSVRSFNSQDARTLSRLRRIRGLSSEIWSNCVEERQGNVPGT